MMLIFNCILFIGSITAKSEYHPEEDSHFDIRWGKVEKLDSVGSVKLMAANLQSYTCHLSDSVSPQADTRVLNDEIISAFARLYNTFPSNRPVRFVYQYWTYELRHGADVRQYHESTETDDDVKNPREEYYLGYFDVSRFHKALEANASFDFKVDTGVYIGNKKYTGVVVNFEDGSFCDLIPSRSRSCTVIYVCVPNTADRVLSISETATCSYQIVFKTSRICSIPGLNQTIQTRRVQCMNDDGTDTIPDGVNFTHAQPPDSSNSVFNANFLKVTTIDGKHVIVRLSMKEDGEAEDEESLAEDNNSKLVGGEVGQSDALSHAAEDGMESVHDAKNDGSDSSKPLNNRIRLTRDERLKLQSFLAGYPINGDTLDPYWQYEFSFGHYIVHYHQERPGIPSNWNITLGRWVPEKHSAWFGERSDEIKPDANEVANLRYTDGSICEEINQHRVTHVKLICGNPKTNTTLVRSRILGDLREVKLCSYVLRLTSHLFCDRAIQIDSLGVPFVDAETDSE